MFARAQALKIPNAMKSPLDAENEMLLKQSISEIMGDESWESNHSLPVGVLRRLEATQPLKLLTASADDSSKKPIGGGSPFQTRERRSATLNQSRPLSVDDIQKAKMRAQFMQNKNGKPQPSQLRPYVSPSKNRVQPEIKEQRSPVEVYTQLEAQPLTT